VVDVTTKKPSDVVGERVSELRARRGSMSARQLAKRCEALGAPGLTAAVIANIETGRRDKTTGTRRRDVTVDELLILAEALEVPPVSLLLPDGADALAVTPDIQMFAPDVLVWVSGEDEPPMAARLDQGTVQRWFEASAPLRLMREFRRAAALPIALAQSVVTIPDGERRERIIEALGELAQLINRMVESGVTPPPLSRDVVDQLGRYGLKYLDQVTVVADGSYSDDLVELLVRAGMLALVDET
jgi:transcriptional regulator with XRE-family HTH domain